MALALDGSTLTAVADAITLTVSLTTANAGDVIIVFGEFNGSFTLGAPATINDSAGLTWRLRASTPVTIETPYIISLVEWYAIASTPLSNDQITVTQNSSQFISVVAFGVNGADTAAPFDANASLPAIASSGSVTVSTMAADTFVFTGARMSSSTSPGDMPAPWTTLGGGDWIVAGYESFTSSQTNLTIPLPSGAVSNGTIGDAIVAAGAPAASYFPFPRQQVQIWG